MANTKKPVILTDYNKETMDEVEALIARNQKLEDSYDPYYIPGYTEQKQANEIAAADDFTWMDRHQKTGLKKSDVLATIGVEPRPLPVVFMPLRVAGMDGTSNANVTRNMMPYQRWGYRPAVWPADFQPHGYGQPAGFSVMENGTLRRDDLQLFVVDGRAERARQESLAREARSRENPDVKQGSGVQLTGTTQQYQESVNFNNDQEE